MQVLTPSKTWDVCVVGSGAGGGMAAKVLTEAGAERRAARGRPALGLRQGRRRCSPGTTTRRGAARPPRAALRRVRRLRRAAGTSRASPTPSPRAAASCGGGAGCSAAAPTTGAASRCASDPGTSRAASRDGLGDDWPIGYDDLKPYYDRLDAMVGIFGSQRGARRTSRTASSCRPRSRAATSSLIKKACDGLGITCIPSRLSILTRPLERPAGLPLLRPVRPRLLDSLELLDAVRPAAAGARHRAS